MCFSAEASFVASGLLAIAGVAALRKGKQRKYSMFAAIPLVFALQQFSEGMVWITLGNNNLHSLHAFSVVFFLIFAQLVWPMYVPISVLLIENDPFRKKILRIALLMGTAFSVYVCYNMIFYPTLAFVTNFHIRYHLLYPDPNYAYLRVSAYFLASVVSLFVSSQPKMKIMAIATLVSFLISVFYFMDTLISVWCFFAAICSITILFIIPGKDMSETEKTKKAALQT